MLVFAGLLGVAAALARFVGWWAATAWIFGVLVVVLVLGLCAAAAAADEARRAERDRLY